jgi:hypothetical protein
MITEVLTFFEALFTEAFIINTSDALRMALVQKRPFQDDPTRKAPYLILTFDETQGLVPDPDIKPEIGGPNYWKLYLKVKAAPKVQTDRETAYTLAGALSMRVAYVIRSAYNQQPAFAGGSRLQMYDWLNLNKIVTHVYGGEREWLSYTEIYFFVRIAETRPFGEYIADL